MERYIHGDCIEKLKDLDENSIGACVTDPPYFLSDENTFDTFDLLENSTKKKSGGFMGESWDGGDVEIVETADNPFCEVDEPKKWIKVNGYFIEPENIYYLQDGTDEHPRYKRRLNVYYEFCKLWTKELYRVLKPGAHVAAFSGARTYHSMANAIEDVGFEIRDSMHWIYSNGFPKGLDISQAMDKHHGTYDSRQTVAMKEGRGKDGHVYGDLSGDDFEITEGAHEDAKKWEGWKTSVKPAHEPIVVAMKPIEGTYVENILKYGVGAINIDDGRIQANNRPKRVTDPKKSANGSVYAGRQKFGQGFDGGSKAVGTTSKGRFPTNIILSKDYAESLNSKTGTRFSGSEKHGTEEGKTSWFGGINEKEDDENTMKVLRRDHPDSGKGRVSRYFKTIGYDIEESDPAVYCPKASPSERNFTDSKNNHPTLKPIRIMWYLLKLFTPEDETVIDPFMGSGTTACASVFEDVDFIGIELNEECVQMSKDRVEYVKEHKKEVIEKHVNRQGIKPEKEYEVNHKYW